MIPALNAEALLLRKRPAPLVVGGAWVVMVVVFAFVVPYIVYSTLAPERTTDRAELLEILVPASVASTSVSSYPLFGGAIMLILGVLVTGSEYRWGTWTARLSQGPSRTQAILAKIVAGMLAVAAIAVVAALASAVAAAVIASIEGQPLTWPAAVDVMASLGAAVLIGAAWMTVGAALGVLFKGTSTALAVGLVWTLGLENAIAGLAGVVGFLEPVRTVLLGTASGSLVAGLGAPTQGAGGTPGVVAHLSSAAATAVLVAYLVGAVALAIAVVRRRDIT